MKTTLMDFIVFLGVSLLPVYLYESGGIQISHAVLAVSALLYFIFFRIHIPPRLTIILLLLVYLVLIRESPAAVNGAPLFSFKDTALKPFLFWSYNLIIIVFFGDYFARHRTSGKIMFRGLAAGILIAAASVLATGYHPTGGIDRAVGTFNNPNQLGYFSVCSLSILCVLFLEKDINRFHLLVFSFLCVFLAIASLSKAAMISVAFPFALLLPMLTVAHQRKIGIIFAGLFLTGVIAGLLYLPLSESTLAEFSFYERLSRTGADSDDNLAARGYWVILEMNWLEFLFGYGSARANDLIGHEVHSTVASVFIYYGFIGLLLFGAIIVTWVLQVYRRYGLVSVFMICLPAMLYGAAHNGTRFTLFWLLLALSSYAPQLRRHPLGKSTPPLSPSRYTY